MSSLILDTETSDTENAEVLSLAWAASPFHESEAQMVFFKPSRPIKFGALAVHHILEEDLAGSRPSSEAPGVAPKVDYWIGHNIDFDWRVMGEPPVKRICTLALSRSLWPELDAHNLSAVAYYVLGATPETRALLRSAHNALADVLICSKILDVIVKVLRVTDERQLWELSEEARIPKIMTFGKHKGKPISDVDRGYANWYRRQEDTDPYLLEAFKRARI